MIAKGANLRGSRMKFEDSFPELWSFLICCFPESDFEYANDIDVVLDAIDENPAPAMIKILEDYKLLQAQVEFPWREIAKAAYRALDSEEATREWLDTVMKPLVDWHEKRQGSESTEQ